MAQIERLHGLMRDVAEAGCLSDGHFEYRSGLRSLHLLDRDRLLCDTHLARRLGYALSRQFFLSRIDVVAAPSVWGAGLAQWVGYFLDPHRPVVYPIQTDGKQNFSSAAAEQLDGKRVLVVDNLILSGKTVQDFAQLITAHGGTPIGVGTLADLSGRTFPIAITGLLNPYLGIFDPAEAGSIPPEVADVPVVRVGY